MIGLGPIGAAPIGALANASAGGNGGTPPSDTSVPTFTGSLTYSVTNTSITIDWSGTTSADNVAVARHEYRIGGSGAYTPASAGEEVSKKHTFPGLPTGTAYQVDLRCVDTSENVSPPLTVTASTSIPGGWVTDAEFDAWLESDDAITNILVETFALVAGVRTPFYWSTLGYTTEGTNSPVFYEPIISAGIPFEEELSIGGGAQLSVGEIEIENTNGVNERFAGYTWVDDLVCLVGDLRWARDSYRKIFVGQSLGLVRKGARAFALRQRDMMEGLNFPMSESKFGGTGLNADELKPLTFGECFNASGTWSNATTLVRQWHNGAINGIGEVRANALRITEQVVVSESTGECQMTVNSQSAEITAHVQGDKFGGVFRKTIAPLVERFITGYGKEEGRYTAFNIDAASFAAFDAAIQYPVGLHLKERTNVIVACDMLAGSVGAVLAPSRDGKFQLIQIALPAAGPSTEIRAEHMVAGTLRDVQHIDPVAAVKLGYLKNWTVQTGLQSRIPAAHKELFEKEWRTVTKDDPALKSKYKLEGDPVQRSTMLLRRVDAMAEAERELALWSVPRAIYEFDGVPEMLKLKKGQALTVYHKDFGMEAGVPAQVLKLTIEWDTRSVKVRFLA